MLGLFGGAIDSTTEDLKYILQLYSTKEVIHIISFEPISEISVKSVGIDVIGTFILLDKM